MLGNLTFKYGKIKNIDLKKIYKFPIDFFANNCFNSQKFQNFM